MPEQTTSQELSKWGIVTRTHVFLGSSCDAASLCPFETGRDAGLPPQRVVNGSIHVFSVVSVTQHVCVCMYVCVCVSVYDCVCVCVHYLPCLCCLGFYHVRLGIDCYLLPNRTDGLQEEDRVQFEMHSFR